MTKFLPMLIFGFISIALGIIGIILSIKDYKSERFFKDKYENKKHPIFSKLVNLVSFVLQLFLLFSQEGSGCLFIIALLFIVFGIISIIFPFIQVLF